LAQDKSVVQQMKRAAEQLPIEVESPSLGGTTGWLNSQPLTSIGLRGKIVLIDVWTYSCINWLRTLPYVRAWAEKYKNQGWVVIGVHTPEFAFEKNVDTVRRAAKNMKINYPTAIDSDQVLMLRGATASQYFHRITTARVKLSGRAKQPKALPQWRWRLPEMHALP
jgi:thiol-disulfide isomerase/thioredoxin